VSRSRHGVIGTNTARSPEPIDADVVMIPPAPMLTATAAPMAAQREREGDDVRMDATVPGHRGLSARCYLIASAFGGLATPPGRLMGAEVKKHS
jgi:hypothetical protein